MGRGSAGLKEGQRTKGKALNLETRTSSYHRTLDLALLVRSGTFLFYVLSLRLRRLVFAAVSLPDA